MLYKAINVFFIIAVLGSQLNKIYLSLLSMTFTSSFSKFSSILPVFVGFVTFTICFSLGEDDIL